MVAQGKYFLTIVCIFVLTPACAGSPPKMERPIKLYNGVSARSEVCRLSQAQIQQLTQPQVVYDSTKEMLAQAIPHIFDEPPVLECIPANDERFDSMGAFTFDDLGVLLRYQEKLLNACEKWSPGATNLVQ